MTSLQILYFLTAADCMSFSQTSEKLYVSQPAVSRQIKLLEQELGCQLFDRSRKNSIRLTPAGIVFQDAFSQIQTIYSRAAETVQSLSSHCPIQLKVGVGSGWDMSTALFCVKNQLAQHYPQAELLFESQDFRELRRRIRTGELDVIICTKTSLIDFDGLEVQEIAKLESRAYVRKGLLCPEQTPLAASDFPGADPFNALSRGIPYGHGTGYAAISGQTDYRDAKVSAQSRQHSAGSAAGRGRHGV